MQQSTKLEDCIHLVEFSYNNSYQTSLRMSPFEVLYGHRCQTPINWSGLEDKLMLVLNMLKEMDEAVKKVRMNLKVA